MALFTISETSKITLRPFVHFSIFGFGKSLLSILSRKDRTILYKSRDDKNKNVPNRFRETKHLQVERNGVGAV